MYFGLPGPLWTSLQSPKLIFWRKNYPRHGYINVTFFSIARTDPKTSNYIFAVFILFWGFLSIPRFPPYHIPGCHCWAPPNPFSESSLVVSLQQPFVTSSARPQMQWRRPSSAWPRTGGGTLDSRCMRIQVERGSVAGRVWAKMSPIHYVLYM